MGAVPPVDAAAGLLCGNAPFGDWGYAMAGFDSETLELIFVVALFAGVFAAFMVFLVWRVYRFFRRERLLGELVYRTRLTWQIWFTATLPLSWAVLFPVMAWGIFLMIRGLLQMGSMAAPAWIWVPPIAVTAFGLGIVILIVFMLATRVEVRRGGLAVYGTWDISWDRVRRVVCAKRSRTLIEHSEGVSVVTSPKSQRADFVAAARECGVDVIDVTDDPEYKSPPGRILWTMMRARTFLTALAVGLAVFLAVVAGFYISVGPEHAAAAHLKEAGAKVDGAFFHFWSVAFEEGTRPTEEQLKLLHEFPQLDWLDFAETQLDDSVTGPLEGLTRLVNLDLSGTQIGDKTLARLSGMQSLSRLNLSETRVTGEGLSSIEGLRGVKSLNLRGTKMTPAGTESISHLLNLQTLVLSETPVEDVWLTPLTSLPHLKNLRLEKTGVTDAGVKTLAQSESLQGLQGLSLSGTQITDAAAEALTQFKGLSWLELNATRLGDAAVEALTRHDSLRDLSLDATQITDRAVTALAGMDNLKELHLAGTHITDASVDAIKGMTHLSYLDIRDTDLSPEKAAEVANALFEARVEWGEREESEP